MPPTFQTNDDRETTAASVLIGSIDIDAGRILAAHDHTGRIARELASRGCLVSEWWRVQGPNRPACAWPSDGPFDAATVRLSKDKTAFEMALHAVISQVRIGGKLWVYGANDEGIKSASKRIATLCPDVRTIQTQRHCRVLEATVESIPPTLKPSLSDWEQTVTLDFPTGAIEQRSYPGVFAKGKLDSGSALLLGAIPKPQPSTAVLDYACGSGVIAMGLLSVEPLLDITLLDADAVAMEAAKHNVPRAKAVLGDSLANLRAEDTFDLIVANPPYHAGKGRSDAVVQALIAQAPRHLTDGGALWMVLQKQVDVRHSLNQIFSGVSHTDQGAYRVWHARSPHP